MKSKSIGSGKPTKKVAKKPTKQATQKADASIAKLTNRIKELEKLLEQANAEVQRLKGKYEPAKEDESDKLEWDKNTTYKDVFDRVCDYIGFVECDRDETGQVMDDSKIDLALDDDGMEHVTWTNYKSFLLGEGEQSIFDVASDSYYSSYGFGDSYPELGKVKIKNTTPVGLMKALDKAGI